MELEELEIVIPRDGTLQVSVKGLRGATCLSATKRLEEATGIVISRNFTAAYYEPEQSVHHHVRTQERKL
ncbi:MAG: hypothetical protein A4E35_02045 [Methanoregula sp. PtaU1.Bin051]|nr:MAG: hypothetical protein A4E35_02045 [Methanoregula sp. PtaU1.Bin051]